MTPEQITASFTNGPRVDSIDPTDLASAVAPGGIPAWLVSLTRT